MTPWERSLNRATRGIQQDRCWVYMCENATPPEYRAWVYLSSSPDAEPEEIKVCAKHAGIVFGRQTYQKRPEGAR
jgi:hypothetical protein